ncbi:MAG: phenylalanine 4-monooxygenase, partial [Lysobacterales bacterium CG_4_10_14_3_um_filter_64_11]
PIYRDVNTLSAVPAGSILGSDKVFNRGTGEGWSVDGDV